MPNKTSLYTIITNDYDTPKPINLRGVDCFMFTDDPNINCDGWKVILIKKTDDQRLQRKIKILGHPELEKYDVTIYVDASITLRPQFSQLLRRYRGGLMIGAHAKRNCVYAEGLEVKKQGKADPELVNNQISEYYESDFPVNFGMWSSGFMIRDRSCEEMNSIWHSKLEQHTHRDQLSLPWALKETGVNPTEININQFMTVSPHKVKTPPKIYYSTPWRSDKNIGKANNEFIELLPDDAWVCIMDGDAMWLRPDWGKCVEQVIMEHGNDFGLIGCVTNRLGGLHQCYSGEFSEDMNMRNHYEIANKLWEDNGTKTEPTSGVAGLCMLFKKSTWKAAGGFKENIITADSEFNKSVRKLGMDIGLAKGLYMMHSYRVHKESHKEAWASISHLK